MNDDSQNIDQYWIDLWNYWHCKITYQGAKIRNFKMANLCERILMKAKKAYYAGSPIMSDNRFDLYEEFLKALRPESKLLVQVGTPQRKMPAPPGFPSPFPIPGA